MKRILLSVLVLLCLIALFFSCQQELGITEPSGSPDKEAGDDTFLRAKIVALGFREDMIEDLGDTFQVEGDIGFSKAALAAMDINRQARFTYIVSDPGDITVRIESSIPTSGVDNWRTEIRQAMNDWNGIAGCTIRFREISSGTPEIAIRSDSGALGDLTIAQAEWPTSGGAPGYRIRINLDWDSNTTVATGIKRYNMVHELGHCIALRHTNWAARGESTGIHINGTLATDAASVMNGGTAGFTWNGFSLGDRVAITQLYPQAWSGWIALGGTLNSAPAVCSWASGRLDVFVKGPSNHLWHKWYNGGWSGWEDLGGTLYSAPAAVSWGSGRIDVFVKGPSSHLWHKWYNSGWSGWEDLGGVLQSAPAVCSMASGRLDVFVRGDDNAVWIKSYNSGWSSWGSLGGTTTCSPGAVSWGNNRIDLFVQGTDRAVWHRWYNGSWHNWENLGGYLAGGTGPAASSRVSDRLDVFVRGSDYMLYRKQWTGLGWTDWQNLGGYLWDAPAAVSWNSSRIDVFVQSTGGQLWQNFYQE